MLLMMCHQLSCCLLEIMKIINILLSNRFSTNREHFKMKGLKKVLKYCCSFFLRILFCTILLNTCFANQREFKKIDII